MCVGRVEMSRGNVRKLSALLDGCGKISLDEWNVWYGWFRPSCVIDGLYTALMMHMIIGEAQTAGIGIACHFEAVNESAIRVTPREVSLSATGQALAMMKPHINGTLLHADSGVVVTEKEGRITVTAVNASFDQRKSVSLERGSACVRAKLYRGTSLLPHSHFEVEPLDVHSETEGLFFELPPHSMAILQY